jgi:RpiR family transcriptional regulator, carbohydrate utilization regulator
MSRNVRGMRPSVLAALRADLPSLTPALAKVATFVADRFDEVLQKSITELADDSGASEASVMRFCRDRGFVGFQDFKLALAKELAVRDEAQAAAPPRDAVEDLAQRSVAALRDTERLLDRSALAEAVKALSSASRIEAFGVAASAVTASYVEYKMIRAGYPCRCLADSHLAIMAAATADRRTTFVVVSSSGSTHDSVSVAERARSGGAYVIAITNRARSPLAAHCNAVLLAASPETPLTGGALPSKISQLLIVDAMLTEMLALSARGRQAVRITAESVSDRSI